MASRHFQDFMLTVAVERSPLDVRGTCACPRKVHCLTSMFDAERTSYEQSRISTEKFCAIDAY